ncbi:hypothetical protein LXL04_009573 [Taraxacum kok-saghyz]
MHNNTWVLADLPPGCKALGCKWILKRKMKVEALQEKWPSETDIISSRSGEKKKFGEKISYAGAEGTRAESNAVKDLSVETGIEPQRKPTVHRRTETPAKRFFAVVVAIDSEERWDGGEGRSLRSSRIGGRSRSREEGARTSEICWSETREKERQRSGKKPVKWIRFVKNRQGSLLFGSALIQSSKSVQNKRNTQSEIEINTIIQEESKPVQSKRNNKG